MEAPRLVERIRSLPVTPVIPDGEVCRLDEKLVSRFHLLSEADGYALDAYLHGCLTGRPS